jgi:hypothetical protein
MLAGSLAERHDAHQHGSSMSSVQSRLVDAMRTHPGYCYAAGAALVRGGPDQ